jgi:hypothetical protein
MANQLTEDEIAEIKKAFSQFDTDNNGYITKTELKTYMQTLWRTLTEKELAFIMTNIDTDKDDNISFDEFQKNISKFNTTGLFVLSDADNDGFITKDELKSIGENMKEDDAAKIINKFDTTNDRKLNFDEYLTMMDNEPKN